MQDVIVIGGGIVGLATALKITKKKPGIKLLLLEKEEELSAHQTGNNSGVIHSGIYYKPGSLKALNCRNGYQQLLGFCDEEHIKYDLCGKVIVATKENQLDALNTLIERGNQNGLVGIKKISKEELNEIEPHVLGIGGIKVPETGIIDYKEVSLKYADKIRKSGGLIQTSEKVIKITPQKKISDCRNI